MIRIKRVYEPASPADGHRVLVDRLWPRGLSKDAAQVDAWMKELAPSDELRRWFDHDPERFSEFRRRYRKELEHEPARTQLAGLAQHAAFEQLTLVFGAKDLEHNNAVVLAEELEKRLRTAARRRAIKRAKARSSAPSTSRATISRRAHTHTRTRAGQGAR